MSMSKEDKEKLLNITKEEVLDKIRKNELSVPSSGSDRDEFLSFINKSPDDRKKDIESINPESGSTTVTPEPDNKGNQSASASVQNNQETIDNSDADWWKEFGYESPEKAKEAHKGLLDLTMSQRKSLDLLNAKEGKRGQELKTLRDEKDKLAREVEELRKKSEPELVEPKAPVRPKVTDFEDGMYDIKYAEAMEQYHNDYEKYTVDMFNFREQKLLKSVESKIPSQIKASSGNNESSQSTVQSEWDKLFKVDIPQFQKDMNLNTTTSIEDISNAYIALSNAKTIEAKKAAQEIVDKITPADKAVYSKVKTAVEAAYDFTNGSPTKKYKTMRAALIDNDLVGEGKLFDDIKLVQLTPAQEIAARESQQKKNEQSVSSIPSSRLTNQDPVSTGVMTSEEKTKRLRDLNTRYNAAIASGKEDAFERSPEFEEYKRLRLELSGRLPNRLRG